LYSPTQDPTREPTLVGCLLLLIQYVHTCPSHLEVISSIHNLIFLDGRQEELEEAEMHDSKHSPNLICSFDSFVNAIFISIIPKHLKFTTFSKDLLTTFLNPVVW
jgi:hypothetical protein